MLEDEQGFSLLELVVAVAILAMMAGPMSEGIRKGIKSWELSHDRAEGNEHRLLTRVRLTDWIKSAYPANPQRRAGEDVAPLTGQLDTLEFIGAVHPDNRINDFTIVLLSLNESNQLTVSLKSDIDANSAEITNHVLIGDLQALSFAYLQSPKGSPLVWADSWTDKITLPRAVRVRLQFQDPQIIWPDLIVPLDNKEWAHCTYDFNALSCKKGGLEV